MQKSLINRFEILNNLLMDHNVKLEPIPKSLITVIQHMKQMQLVRQVEAHYSYMALITHVFENVYIHKGSLNSHSLDSNLP